MAICWFSQGAHSFLKTNCTYPGTVVRRGNVGHHSCEPRRGRLPIWGLKIVVSLRIILHYFNVISGGIRGLDWLEVLPSGILSTPINPLLYFSGKPRENGRISLFSRVIASLAWTPLRDHRGELCFTIRIVYAFVPRSYLHPHATLSNGFISGTINLPLKTSILVGYTLLRPIAQTVGRYLSITNLTVRHLNFRVLQAIVYWLGTSMLESARYLEITKLIPI